TSRGAEAKMPGTRAVIIKKPARTVAGVVAIGIEVREGAVSGDPVVTQRCWFCPELDAERRMGIKRGIPGNLDFRFAGAHVAADQRVGKVDAVTNNAGDSFGDEPDQVTVADAAK